MELHFAPLQGYADHLYRRFHASTYGATDAYYTPFIRIEKGEPRRQDMNRLDSAIGDGTNLLPQIIFNSAEEFKILTDAIKGKGYTQIDLNLGCPYPMQTRKGRGASMISDLKTMSEISQLINSDPDTSYSIKMRLGIDDKDEWTGLMPILNGTRLMHITMHPRIARQMYGGELYAEEFDKFKDMSKNPVIWNGDILSTTDISHTLTAHSGIKGIMIGRGLLARPSLAAEWYEGKEWDHDKRLNHIMDFHSQLLEAYEDTLCGQAQILQKIKPFWEYLEPEIGHKPYKAIHKATTLPKYKAAVESIG